MVVSLLAVLVLSTPASAQSGGPQDDDTRADAVCVLEPGGASGTGPQQVQSVFADEKQGGGWDSQQLMDIDAGFFSLATLAICTGLDFAAEGDKRGSPEVIEPAVVLIDAEGTFDNLVCGTGDLKGTAVIAGDVRTHYLDKFKQHPVTRVGELKIHAVFAVQFVAHVGKLSLVVQQVAQDGQGGHSHVGENNVEGGSGTGVIHAHPVEWQGSFGSPFVFGCVGTFGDQQDGSVNLFVLEGVFALSLFGEGARDDGSQAAGSGSDA